MRTRQSPGQRRTNQSEEGLIIALQRVAGSGLRSWFETETLVLLCGFLALTLASCAQNPEAGLRGMRVTAAPKLRLGSLRNPRIPLVARPTLSKGNHRRLAAAHDVVNSGRFRFVSSQVKWSAALEGPPEFIALQRGAFAQSGSVLAVSVGNGIAAVDLPSGRVLWRNSQAGWPLSADRSAVYARDGSGIVRIDALSGRVAWSNAACEGSSNISDVEVVKTIVLVLCASPAMLVGLSPANGDVLFHQALLSGTAAQEFVRATPGIAIIRAVLDGSTRSTLISVLTSTGAVLAEYEDSMFIADNEVNAYLFKPDCGTCLVQLSGTLVQLRLIDGTGTTMRFRQPFSDPQMVDVAQIVGVIDRFVYVRSGSALHAALYRYSPATGNFSLVLNDVMDAAVFQNTIVAEVGSPNSRSWLWAIDGRTRHAQAIAMFGTPVFLKANPAGKAIAAWSATTQIVLTGMADAFRVPTDCDEPYSYGRDAVIMLCRHKGGIVATLFSKMGGALSLR